MANNGSLNEAKKAKFNEFYTQYEDVEREMFAYWQFDHNFFRGLKVLCCCDDPLWSNFFKYFAQVFNAFGIAEVICTSYAGGLHEETEIEKNSPQYDAERSKTHGKKFVLNRDITRDGILHFEDVEWTYLEGDGDFRSEEVSAIRDRCDIIITNPPFSLIREFIPWILEANKKFIIMAPMNSLKYKDIFPLVKEGKIWSGYSKWESKTFETIPDYDKGEKRENGKFFTSLGNVIWLTNVEHGRRHQPLQLITMEENLRHSPHTKIRELGYQKYDNYDAIEIPYIDAIPNDYTGIMGAPMTFIEKHCPEQFEIIGEANHGSDNIYDLFKPIVDGKEKYPRVIFKKIGDNND